MGVKTIWLTCDNHMTIIWLSCDCCDCLVVHIATDLMQLTSLSHVTKCKVTWLKGVSACNCLVTVRVTCVAHVWLVTSNTVMTVVTVMWLPWLSHDCHVIVMWLQCSNVLTLIDSIETTYFYKVHFSNRFIRHTSFVKCLQPENKKHTSFMNSITLYTTLH